jgi:hypothetical protein
VLSATPSPHLPLFFKASSYVTLIKMGPQYACCQLFHQVYCATSLSLQGNRQSRGPEVCLCEVISTPKTVHRTFTLNIEKYSQIRDVF